MRFLAQVQKKYKITSSDLSGAFLKSLHDYILGDDAPPTAKDKGAKSYKDKFDFNFSKNIRKSTLTLYRGFAHPEDIRGSGVKMSFIADMKSRYRVFAATVRQSEIIDEINYSPCEDKSDEAWEHYKDMVGLDEEEREDWENQDVDDCLDEVGDTGYFFQDPEALPQGTWLIHFTKEDPVKIIQRGFKGASLEHLGLTRGGGKRLQGDFALAYPLKDTKSLTGNEYGTNAIVFQSDDAVLAWHKSDDEHQAIFFVKSMRSIICLKQQKDKIEVFDKGGEPLATVKNLAEVLDAR